MSVHRRTRQQGVAWQVKWRDERGRQRSRTFSLKRDADTWDADVRLRKTRGELRELDAGKQKLADFVQIWWARYGELHLSPKTLATYAGIRDRHLLPRLGHVQLGRITPDRIQELSVSLHHEGVGAETVRKTLAMTQGILERAVEWGRIPRNPVRSVRKPVAARRVTVRPLSPRQIELLRTEMTRRGWHRDATVTSVLAYAGLRPGEVLALRWSDIGTATIVIDKSISLGQETATKTRARRTVRLLSPLSDDLSEWQSACRDPAADSLVFPTRHGTPWSDSDYRNWRRRRYCVAARAVGLGGVRVYDLRHSFASLLLHERMGVTEVSQQMGHSLQTLFDTYAHVIEELRASEPASATTEILRARAHVPE